jgi:hypothetical protein
MEDHGEPLYLGVIVISTSLIAFVRVAYAILGLAVFLAIAGFAMTPQGKTIRKQTIFQDKFVTLLVIIASFIAILLVFFIKAV